MYILGISCYYHDAACCILKDGHLLAASEEERFSRIKHDFSFPVNAIKFCLDSAGINGSAVDFVVFNEKPFLKLERIVKTILSTYPLSYRLFQGTFINWVRDKMWIKATIEEHLGIEPEKILFSQHHLSHAASAFFSSAFKEAAIFTCDGVGEWATTTLGKASADWDGTGKNEIQLLEEIRFPHSLGLLYSVFTAFLGFEVNEGEYKVMGMSAFGTPKYTDKIYELINVSDDGSFRLNMKYFSFHYHTTKSFNKRFEKIFGKPRSQGSRFVTSQTSLYDYTQAAGQEELECNQHYADIAASIQKVTEDVLIKIARHLHQITRLKKLCFSGGVALNCVANSRILQESPFDEIFIQPSAGDGGGALGAALYAYHCLLCKPRKLIMEHACWGKEYKDQDIEFVLKEEKVNYLFFNDRERLVDTVAKALVDGKVAGWFQGRFEWGPRALGNRSILASPMNEKMKDIVNIKIKFREPFRPFAPSVLIEHAGEFFDLGKAEESFPLKFMLFTLPVKRKDLIPAVTHIDGTSRIQVVEKDVNPLYYSLIERFYELTGVPVLLNTSFNIRGEPMVESPDDALKTFYATGMDLLVLGDFIVYKQ